MSKIKDFWKLMKVAGSGFGQHKVLKLSASLCFYAIFSIGPMMLVIIFISGIFFRRQAIEGTINSQIGGLIGNDAAMQIQELIKNTSLSSNNFMAVVGFVLLFFAATTVFTEMQDSMNTIWNLKVKTNRTWQRTWKNRLLSFFIIAGLGFLVLIFLILNGLLEGFMDKLHKMFPQIAINTIYIVNLLLTLFVVALLFAFIYKVLPDIYIQWKYVVVGALFAAVLFMIGKFGLTFYINNSNMSSTYSSAGSLVILLLWVYYSATILYFGAEFTKAYALKYSTSVKPKDYAISIRIITAEDSENNGFHSN